MADLFAGAARKARGEEGLRLFSRALLGVVFAGEYLQPGSLAAQIRLGRPAAKWIK
jgi:hypothetical protein